MAEVERFDAAVIGAGAGGMTVAVGLAAFGRRVALIEAARVGGDCTNVGCIPSKRLLHLAREPGARHDARSILADVRRTRDALEARERDEFGAMDGITLIAGHATIAGPRSVRVQRRGRRAAAPDARHRRRDRRSPTFARHPRARRSGAHERVPVRARAAARTPGDRRRRGRGPGDGRRVRPAGKPRDDRRGGRPPARRRRRRGGGGRSRRPWLAGGSCSARARP